MDRINKAVITWFFAGAVLVTLMVVVGGITRLTSSGLSMAHWSLAGSLPPVSDKDWELHFDKYRQTPEFRVINHDYTLSDFKRIFWWEFIHRFLGRTIGIVFILPFLWFLFKGYLKGLVLKRSLILLLVGGFQGFMGWYMVKSGLTDKPHVDHIRLAAHLITALIAYSICVMTVFDLLKKSENDTGYYQLKRSAILLTVLVGVQIMYGAFVAGLKAGLIYNNFPKMNENWIAADVTRISPLYLNLVNNGSAVQLIHRWIGVAILLTCFCLIYLVRIDKNGSRRKVVKMTTILALTQFLLGVITLVFQVPIVPAVIHQLCAFLLFGSSLILVRYYQ